MIQKHVLVVFAILMVSSVAIAQPAAAPAAPTTQSVASQDPAVAAVKAGGASGAKFLEMHESFLKRAKEGNIDVLFLGDSITAGWATRGKDQWKANYESMKAANFGIGGDRTQHVIWRIENGELENIHPKVCVLMIGTNNVNSATTAEDIARGVTKIAKTVNEKTGAKILLLAVFPRERPADKDNQMGTIKQINAIISKLDDGKTIRYLDIGPKFMGEDGHLNQKLFADGLHPNAEGYQVWVDAMKPLLEEMLKG